MQSNEDHVEHLSKDEERMVVFCSVFYYRGDLFYGFR
jgi:hypothetical protein